MPVKEGTEVDRVDRFLLSGMCCEGGYKKEKHQVVFGIFSLRFCTY
jgi:hypothetical protein